jgi:chromosome segregation ATPase
VSPPDRSKPDPPAPGPQRRGFLGFGRRRPAATEPPATLHAARRQVADLQKRHDKLDAAAAALRHDLSSAVAERDQLRQRVTALDSELGTVRSAHAVAELSLREARDKWGEAERRGTELQQALTVEQTAHQQWQAAATELQARFAALAGETETLRKAHDALEIAHAAERQGHQQFEALAAERASRIEAQSAEITALQRAYEHTTAAHQAESQAHAYFETLATDKAAALDTLTAEHAALAEQHAALTAAHAEEQRAHAHFEALAEQKSTALDALTTEHAALTEQHQTLTVAHAEEQRTRELGEIAAAANAADLTEKLTKLQGEHASLTSEHETLVGAHAKLDEMHRAEHNARTQWEAHAKELTDTLAAEREQYQRTLEDERRTAEAARAEQAFQHREEVERLTAEHTTVLTATQQQLAQTRATLETTTADLGATRADVQRLTEDLQASRGEGEAANVRAREESELRQAAEKRREEVEEELDYVRSEVLGGAGDPRRKRGLLRRGKQPATLKAAETLPRPLVQVPTADEAPAVGSEEVEEIIERRLFGDG